ncbi:XdhC family protein [Algirhabdus cladophorae]|uniref:XdhC family protein n=1 Tax=Algirhabdus cladophorae TaxID=3377108 RepID=UPI003B848B26
MSPDFNDIPAIALEWHRARKGAAIATVVQTWGSAPRAVGSMLVVSRDGDMQGSVSGGCVEGAVVVEAMEALEDGTPRLLEFGVSDDEAFAVGLACGGTIKVLVDPVGHGMPLDLLTELVAARAAKRSVALTTDLKIWDRGLTYGPTGPWADRFMSDKSGIEQDLFVGIHNPPLRMAIIGGVHIAQALVPMARIAGFEPIVIDPREAFAHPDRFGDTPISNEWPDDALFALKPDHRMAVVTLTHDPKLDDPAIEMALKTKCFYLGCLGSTRTHAKRLDRLRALGVGEANLARINGPVGLDIGAKNPSEIAISIMAEVISALRQR